MPSQSGIIIIMPCVFGGVCLCPSVSLCQQKSRQWRKTAVYGDGSYLQAALEAGTVRPAYKYYAAESVVGSD